MLKMSSHKVVVSIRSCTQWLSFEINTREKISEEKVLVKTKKAKEQ